MYMYVYNKSELYCLAINGRLTDLFEVGHARLVERDGQQVGGELHEVIQRVLVVVEAALKHLQRRQLVLVCNTTHDAMSLHVKNNLA